MGKAESSAPTRSGAHGRLQRHVAAPQPDAPHGAHNGDTFHTTDAENRGDGGVNWRRKQAPTHPPSPQQHKLRRSSRLRPLRPLNPANIPPTPGTDTRPPPHAVATPQHVSTAYHVRKSQVKQRTTDDQYQA